VVLAYDQLRTAGLVESRQGSGTFVARPTGPAPRPREETGHSFLVDTVTRAAAEEPGDTVSFMGACLPAPDGVIEGVWDEVRRDVAGLTAGAGYSPQGLPALRQAVAAWFDGRGLPTTPDEVLITSGAQQAIDLAARFLVAGGETVLIEDPTYIGAIDAFTVARARRQPLPVGPTGVDVEALGRLVSETAPVLTYLVPTFHNPTGTVLSESGRREVARLAERRGTTILEDESLVDLSLGGDVPPPIAAFAPRAPVLTVGSLSKLFWGGLRVGWVRGPRPLVARLTHLKVTADLSGSAVSQALAARLLPHRDEVTLRRRRQSTERLDHLSALLRKNLPEWTFTRPKGGLTLWVRLPSPAAEELARVALRHGVSIVPGPVHSPSGGYRDHVRLPFVLDAEAMAEGVARLARAWTVSGQPDRDRRLGVIV
jgi:DNA-binding transcriptional MocR family regulator